VDPCTEVATLIVSYVWALRDLPARPSVSYFANAETIGEFRPPSNNTVAAGEQSIDPAGVLRGAIVTAIGNDLGLLDLGLLARLRDIARRGANERWPIGRTTQGSTEDDLSLDVRLQNITLERRREALQPRSHESFADRVARLRVKVEYGLGLRSPGAGPDEYAELGRQVLDAFARHASLLIDNFGDVKIRPGRRSSAAGSSDRPRDVTREDVTDEIASRLLGDTTLFADMARELDYRPVLLRPIDGKLDLLADPDYPGRLLAACKGRGRPVPFQLMLHEELGEIHRSRVRRVGMDTPDDARTPVLKRAFDRHLVGVAFSGGGIRSATFNLGVLQSLAGRGWLPAIDYLSTVSGGGYIGGWLLGWTKRRGSILSVQQSLRGYGSCDTDGALQAAARNPDPGSEHVRPIRLLREYSNYLTPQFSAVSADTWTIVSIWMRNTVVNLLVLTMFLMAVLIAPRLLGVAFDQIGPRTSIYGLLAFIGLASVLIGLNLRSFDDPVVRRSNATAFSVLPQRPSERGDAPFAVIATIAIPALIAMFFAMAALWRYTITLENPDDIGWLDSPIFRWTAAVLASGIAVTALLGRMWRTPSVGTSRSAERSTDRITKHGWRFVASTFWGAVAAVAGGFLVKELADHLLPVLYADSYRGTWLAVGFGPLVLLGVLMLVLVIYLGLEGLAAPDERREWWSRLGAWLGLIAATWATLTSISFLGPYAVATAGVYAGGLGWGWGTFTAVGTSLATSGKSNGINLTFDKNWLSAAVIALAPYLFIFGFLIGVSVLAHAALYFLNEHEALGLFGQNFTSMAPLPFSLQRYADTYWSVVEPRAASPAVFATLLALAAVGLAWRADVNEFSLHHMYKNRLVRAYLGASRSRVHRRPNSFTGLDMDDDIKLWRLTTTDESLPDDERTDCRVDFAGPYPIINTTMNMTAGDELAWQERKGQSFIFTPLYCGFDFATKQTIVSEKVAAQFAYRPTREFARGDHALPGSPDNSISVGTAMAISGAAANPNAGYHSSPAVAFLLTVFNARLGWWIGNPLAERSWKNTSPPIGLFYLLSELFGFSGVKRAYVNLSDGGHFDNMGLYELIRRRCRYIVVCDAEQDDRYSFNGMAGAIRKCRVDFGVVIEMSTSAIVPKERVSAAHVAVGSIRYPGEEECGTLVYLKASLTGDEPADVLEYRDRNPEFPHQTTGDQFFDESQFESYRALGQHIADHAFGDWPTGENHSDAVRKAFEVLRKATSQRG